MKTVSAVILIVVGLILWLVGSTGCVSHAGHSANRYGTYSGASYSGTSYSGASYARPSYSGSSYSTRPVVVVVPRHSGHSSALHRSSHARHPVTAHDRRKAEQRYWAEIERRRLIARKHDHDNHEKASKSKKSKKKKNDKNKNKKKKSRDDESTDDEDSGSRRHGDRDARAEDLHPDRRDRNNRHR